MTNDISGFCLDQNVYFVNPASGDDQNSGSEENPFKTIRHALTMIKKGEKIIPPPFICLRVDTLPPTTVNIPNCSS